MLSLGCLILGLIRPSVFSTLFHTNFTRQKTGLIFGGLFVVVMIMATFLPAEKEQNSSDEASRTAAANTAATRTTAAGTTTGEQSAGTSSQDIQACDLLSKAEVETVMAEAFREPTEVTGEFMPAKTCVYETVANDALGDPKIRITLQYYTAGTYTNRPADKQTPTETKIGDNSYFSESGILFLNKGDTLINMLGNITYQQEEELGKKAFQHMP